MQKKIGDFVQRGLFFQPRRQFFKKISNFLQGRPVTMNDDSKEMLKQNSAYNFPVDELDYKNQIPMNLQQDKDYAIANEKEISDLERTRMRNLDRMLGTNTHFHEIKDYEERLDSEHVMQKQILKAGTKKESVLLQKLFSFDPQEQRPLVKIRNFREFTKNYKEFREYPEHVKQGIVKTFNNNFKWTNNYDYLEVDKIDIFDRDPNQVFENEVQFRKFSEFIMRETVYTEMSLLRNTKLEDRILKEYYKRMDMFNVLPLYYDNFIYYFKDSKLTGGSSFDLYRTKNENQDQNSFFKVTDFETNQEQIVMTQKVFLQNKFKGNRRIFIKILRQIYNNRRIFAQIKKQLIIIVIL